MCYNAPMETIREQISINDRTGLFPAAYFEGFRWAVLDIETLGLSPGRAPAILCGIVVPDEAPEAQNAPRTAQVTQFLAESIATREDERAMLLALEEALADIDILVTYNGRQFDLPYLAKRCERTQTEPMRPRYNLDVYPVVRYCTDIGQFVPNLRQKTLEEHCSVCGYISRRYKHVRSLFPRATCRGSDRNNVPTYYGFRSLDSSGHNSRPLSSLVQKGIRDQCR